MTDERYILALDAGSTGVKATIFDRQAKVVSRSYYQLNVTFSQDGRVETDPEEIFRGSVATIKEALADANIGAHQIASMGIANQRTTFTSWDRRTGKIFHPFLNWSDLRGAEVCDTANSALKTRAIRLVCGLLYFITRDPRFLTMQKFTLKPSTVGPRLAWAWKTIPEMREAYKRGDLYIGTIDSYLLWKFTGGKVHATDYSNASTTGLYDMYAMHWSGVMRMLMYPYEIPPWSVMPEIKPTASEYGYTIPELFGASIPINVLFGDQQAALFGNCCFDVGEAKATLGTGLFLDIITGDRPCASYGGLYPLIAWKIKDKTTYCMEGGENAAGIVFEWLKNVGFVNSVSEIERVASSVDNSGGVYFIPALYGLAAPYWDSKARGMFIGMTAFSSKGHMLRAAVESMGFRIAELKHVISTDLPKLPKLTRLKVDGGVTNNNLVCQSIADIADLQVDRPTQLDATSLGVAFMAGLHIGFWKDLDELRALRKCDTIFSPRMSDNTRARHKAQWSEAIKRSLGWYGEQQNTSSKLPFFKLLVLLFIVSLGYFYFTRFLRVFGYQLVKIAE